MPVRHRANETVPLFWFPNRDRSWKADIGSKIFRPICEPDHIPPRRQLHSLFARDRSRGEEGFVMSNSVWRNYRTNPHEFDGWIRANAFLGAILAIGLVAMAVAGLYSPGPVDSVTELTSIAAPN
jgi:hypothetical protein